MSASIGSSTRGSEWEGDPAIYQTRFAQQDVEDRLETTSQDEAVNHLVRSYSLGLVRTTSRVDPSINPFLSTHPELDPSSLEQFNAKKWARALLQHSTNHPDKYPRPTAGVSYRDLSVYGQGLGSSDYQKDVLNVLYQGPELLKRWIRQRWSKVPILDNFEGLVRSGELLLVLGRPGSGVSTLLKTIAGETKNLQVDPNARICYQGLSPFVYPHRPDGFQEIRKLTDNELQLQASRVTLCTERSAAK